MHSYDLGLYNLLMIMAKLGGLVNVNFNLVVVRDYHRAHGHLFKSHMRHSFYEKSYREKSNTYFECMDNCYY